MAGCQANWELIARRARYRLAGQPGWILAGLTGALLVICSAIIRPFDLRRGMEVFEQTAVLMCLWLAVFTVLYIIGHWLRPFKAETGDELDQAPLSALQYFLHRLTDLAALPLLVTLLALPLYGVLLVYTGDPYNSGSQVGEWAWRAYWDWYEFPLPWAWRAFFVGLNILAAPLMIMALATFIEEATRWLTLRVLLLIGLPVAHWFVVNQAEYDYFRMCYRQTRGHDAWNYLVIAGLLVLLPLVFGWLKPVGRAVLGLIVGLALLGFGALPYLTHDASDGLIDITGFGRLLGDLRFALAYFIGHLSLDKNIDILLNRYHSTVLLTDVHAGNLIPQRVAVWVGAGIYPPAIAIASVLLYALGLLLRRRHPLE
ncbi:hypothetical protein JW859_00135 [bacterium]|nr:hypothetical protein [bacterium]